jgi:hypothetical protein
MSAQPLPSSDPSLAGVPMSRASARMLAIRLAYYGAPVVLLLVLYWKGLTGWFMMDDFAWLSLPLQIHGWRDVLTALFLPEAQGTVRFLSERAFFLALSSLFGVNIVPFRIVMVATAAADIFLIMTIARKLTGSALAAFAAAILYVCNPALTLPVSWPSAYNELLWPLLLLSSFYLFLRYTETGRTRYYAWQWITFLLGFGALELNVLYPAIAALYALCRARRYFIRTLPMFAISALYTIVHFVYMPYGGGDIYRMYFDGSLPETFVKYFGWTFGPCRLGHLVNARLRLPGNLATIAIAAAVLAFAAARLARRDWLPVFLLGWWALIIAPLLPLKNHVTDYYPAVPMIGICILGGWAFSRAIESGWMLRLGACLLALAYCGGNYLEARPVERWRHDASRRFEIVLDGIQAAYHTEPRQLLLIGGVDRSLYVAGFGNLAFQLFHLPKVDLLPGTEDSLMKPQPVRWLADYVISPGDAVSMVERHAALVLDVHGDRVEDITDAYAAKIEKEHIRATVHRVDVGQAWSASRLGPSWYALTQGFRWMPQSATVRLSGPEHAGERLYISGFCPAAVLRSGPVHMTVLANDHLLGTVAIADADQPFDYDFALPADLTGGADFVVTIRLDKVLHISTDPRALGMVFGAFEVK